MMSVTWGDGIRSRLPYLQTEARGESERVRASSASCRVAAIPTGFVGLNQGDANVLAALGVAVIQVTHCT